MKLCGTAAQYNPTKKRHAAVSRSVHVRPGLACSFEQLRWCHALLSLSFFLFFFLTKITFLFPVLIFVNNLENII
jgi:hypothetical protein